MIFFFYSSIDLAFVLIRREGTLLLLFIIIMLCILPIYFNDIPQNLKIGMFDFIQGLV